MKTLKRIASVGTALALVLTSVAAIVPAPRVAAADNDCTWTGAGSDNKFSTAANWSNCNDTVPATGDYINFATAPTTDLNLVNDLNIKLAGVSVAPVPNSQRVNLITIDKLDFSNGALASVGASADCYGPIQVFAESITGDGNFSNLNGALILMLTSPTEKKVSMNLAGSLRLSSGYGSFTSGSSVDSVIIASPGSSGSCETGIYGAVSSLFDGLSYDSLTVEKDAFIVLPPNYSKPITLGGGSGTGNPEISLIAQYSGANYIPTTYTWSSPLTLLSNAGVYVGNQVTANFTGSVNGVGFAIAKTATSEGIFNFNPSSNNSSSITGTQQNTAKTTKLTGDIDESVNVVDKETTILENGSRSTIIVLSGGVLKGNGTIKQELLVAEGGAVAPGMSPGCITAKSLELGGKYLFELGGKDACTGYDQLKVTGNTGLVDGDVKFSGNTAVLETSRFNDYTPKQGDVFVIIDQGGDKAVEGTFKDLPEGATFTQNGIVFKISYKGGDGNDVTLTVQNTPTTPDSGFALVAANPLVSVIGLALVSAGMIFIARKLQAKRR